MHFCKPGTMLGTVESNVSRRQSQLSRGESLIVNLFADISYFRTFKNIVFLSFKKKKSISFLNYLCFETSFFF